MKENLLKKKKKGFTLIELIVVIAIIAIISLIAIPKVMGYQADAKVKADKANAKTIANVVATEITNGDIAADTAISNIEIDSLPEVATAPAKTDVTAKYFIIKNLQSVPKIQSSTNSGKNFFVNIDDKNNVTIFDGNSGSGGKQIYP